ncbi:o-succinylbenzoate synthase [Angustibacter sp. Root456]|uniref:o-succinylbenzoate synthase n=1 Tax=Angustibacter sp. Root456 TaxID=1736539 RepID=UPI0006FB6E98|nr:o-succinylbenzoate synthase [Angustibacter sp. Root456]KQX66162.1 O-succinylbenzoate synthase [Angustibacter sp. Root456]
MLPDLDALLAAAHVVSLPMRVRFRSITTREAVVLQGPHGWGEFSPFVEYDDAEAARWLAAGVESAWSPPVSRVRDAVPVNATVPAVPAADVAAVLERFDGCRTAKVKVAEPGQSLADDVVRVGEVRRLLGPTGRVRVDANGAWSVDDALRAAQALAPYDLEYLEQPCATLDELGELRRALARSGVDVLVAADESIRKADDPLKVAAAGSADVVVVKVAPLGGVRAALEVAEACGLPVVVSSALDTSVGIAAGVALAAALPDLPYACGLGTVGLFERDVASTPLRPRAGELSAAAASAVHPDQLADVLAGPERQRWWRDRLARCHAVLSARS